MLFVCCSVQKRDRFQIIAYSLIEWLFSIGSEFQVERRYVDAAIFAISEKLSAEAET